MRAISITYVLGLAVVISGCGKDDDNDNTPDSDSPKVTATVDGTNWSSATTSYALTQDDVQFSGRNAAGDIIELFMESPTGPVTISSADTNTYILARYETAAGAEWKSNMPGGSVTITVTSFNATSKVGSGTFSFVAPAANTSASGVKTVTNGTFTAIKLAM